MGLCIFIKFNLGEKIKMLQGRKRIQLQKDNGYVANTVKCSRIVAVNIIIIIIFN